MSIGKMKVGDFQGPKETISLPKPPPYPYPSFPEGCGASAVSGPEVPVKILERTIAEATSQEEASEAKEKLAAIHKNRAFMVNVVQNIVGSLTGRERHKVSFQK